MTVREFLLAKGSIPPAVIHNESLPITTSHSKGRALGWQEGYQDALRDLQRLGLFDADTELTWEYRVVSALGMMASPDGSKTVLYNRDEAYSLADYFSLPCWVDRRRQAGRPGPWEPDD